jgi:hypothetical protein
LSSFDNVITLTLKNMATRALKLEDFGAQKLSKNQQKIVRGGDGNPITNPIPPTQEGDPGKGGTATTG